MPKQISGDGEIYIAPGIKGKYEDRNPVAIDERNNNERLNPRDINHKITIYEREVKEWFLNPALALVEKNSFDNGFIVLMICMSYFEGVEQYKTGIESDRRSKECFKDSVKRLYPNEFQDKEIEKLYTKSRCGLFHNGMVKGGVIFSSDFTKPIEFQDHGEIIRVDPSLLLRDIREDFNKYISELRSENHTDARITRENFDRMFTVL